MYANEPNTRPISDWEKQYYDIMATHYEERAQAIPQVPFLKQTARLYRNIAQSGFIGTIDAAPPVETKTTIVYICVEAVA